MMPRRGRTAVSDQEMWGDIGRLVHRKVEHQSGSDEVSIKVIGDKPTMVLFMSDGQATREHYPETLRSWKQLANVPTVLAFGFGQGAKMDALDEIVQINTGDSSSVAKKVDENDIRTSMASYYQHPSLAHRNSDNTELHVAMTAPYWDFSGIGLVVTISIPLYVQSIAVHCVTR